MRRGLLPLLCLLFCGLPLLPACAGRQAPPPTWRDAPRQVSHADSPLLLERLADKQFADGHYESAARRYEALLAERPGHAPAALYLGLCQWLSGRPDLAGAFWEDFSPRLEELRPVFRSLAAGLTLLEYRLQARRAAGERIPDLRPGRTALLPPSGGLAEGARGKALHHLAIAALRRDFGVNAVPRERVQAFLDEAQAGPDLDPAAAIRLAGGLGAEYAVQWRVEPGPGDGVRLTLLLLGVESPDGRAARQAEELAAARGRLSSLEAGLAAARKELEALDGALAHQELAEQMDRLLAERGPRAEEVSALLREGKAAEAKEALARLRSLEQEIEQVYQRQQGYRRSAYELFLGVYRPTAEVLRQRRTDQAKRTEDLEARAGEARESVAALQHDLDSPLPADGRFLSADLPAAGLLPTRFADQAARLLAASLGRSARPGLPGDLSAPGDPLGQAALEALGQALAAMDAADYGTARKRFPAARTLEPSPPDLPWPGFDPAALSRLSPPEVAEAFAGCLDQAADRLRAEYAARGWSAREFDDRLEGR